MPTLSEYGRTVRRMSPEPDLDLAEPATLARLLRGLNEDAVIARAEASLAEADRPWWRPRSGRTEAGRARAGIAGAACAIIAGLTGLSAASVTTTCSDQLLRAPVLIAKKSED